MDKNEYEEEDVVTTEEETETVETETEDEQDYKALYEAEKGRRKRAETDLEKAKAKSTTTHSNSTLSEEEIAKKVKDQLALEKLKDEDQLTDDELQEIKDFADVKKISLSEAIKSPVIKRLIEDSKEIKRSKEITSTDNRRVGSNKISDEQLLAKANSGKSLSEEEIIRLAKM